MTADFSAMTTADLARACSLEAAARDSIGRRLDDPTTLLLRAAAERLRLRHLDPYSVPPQPDPEPTPPTFASRGGWGGLTGKKVRLCGDMNTYEGTVTDWSVDPGGNAWLVVAVPDGVRMSGSPRPGYEVVVNLAHVRTLRVIA